ncbi:hypothetical protein BT69DRAFT_1303275, partial [Atractiella rhizophila]
MVRPPISSPLFSAAERKQRRIVARTKAHRGSSFEFSLLGLGGTGGEVGKLVAQLDWVQLHNETLDGGLHGSTSYEQDGEAVNVTYASGPLEKDWKSRDALFVRLFKRCSLTRGLIEAEVMATQIEDLLYSEVPVSGLMGFGWSALVSSDKNNKPYWERLFTDPSYGFSQPAFGVHITRAPGERTETSGIGTTDHGGSLVLGGWDDSLLADGFDGVEFVELTEESYWELPVVNLTLNGTPIPLVAGSTAGVRDQTAAIDTGTTLIAAPVTVTDALYAAIPGAVMISGNEGLHAYPAGTN